MNYWKIGSGTQKRYIVVFESIINREQKMYQQKEFKTMDEAEAYIIEQIPVYKRRGFSFHVWVDIIKEVTTRFKLKDEHIKAK